MLTLALGGCKERPSPEAPEPLASWGPKVAAGETSAEEEPYAPRFYAPAGGDGKLHVYFLEVDRGESALIVSPTGRTVLVDGGPRAAGRHLVHRLPELLHDSLDLVVLSHAHEDHYGGLAAVTGALGTKRFLDPQVLVPDPGYRKLLDVLKLRHVDIFGPTPDPKKPDAPVRISLGGGATLTLYWPRAAAEPLLAEPDALEKNSVVMRLTYGHTSFLFTGDARAETEEVLLARRIPLHATILKVSAHGADVATTRSFLEFVAPKAAFISEGPPGAPTDRAQVLARLARINARVFLSEAVGEVHAVSDGRRVTVTSERPAPNEAPGASSVFDDPTSDEDEDGTADSGYVASQGGRVFHKASCPGVRAIPEGRRLSFPNRESAAKHRKPAEDCRP